MKKKAKIDEDVLNFFHGKTVREIAYILEMSYRILNDVLKKHKVRNRNSRVLEREDILKFYPWLQARVKRRKIDIRQIEKLKKINSKEPKTSIGHGNTIYDKIMKKGKSVFWHYNPYRN